MTATTTARGATADSVPVFALITLLACGGYIGSIALLQGSTQREGLSSPITVTVTLIAALGFTGLAVGAASLLAGVGLPRWVGVTVALACGSAAAMAWSLGTVVPGVAGVMTDVEFEAASSGVMITLLGVPKMVFGLVGFGALGVIGWRRRLMPRMLAVLFVLAGVLALLWPFPPGGVVAALGCLWLSRTGAAAARRSE